MLVSTDEVNKRVDSFDNLVNQLAVLRVSSLNSNPSGSSRQLKDPSTLIQVKTQPDKSQVSVAELVDDIDEKIAIGNIKTKTLKVMGRCMTKLEATLDEIETKNLPRVIRDLGQTVKSLEPDADKVNDNRVQLLVYSPERMKDESEFEVIHGVE